MTRYMNRLNAEQANFRNKVRVQKRLPAAIFIAAMLLISIGGISYVIVRQEDWTTVVYETNGVTLELGVDWLYGEFTGMDHPDNIHLSVDCVGEIAGGNGGSAHFNFGH